MLSTLTGGGLSKTSILKVPLPEEMSSSHPRNKRVNNKTVLKLFNIYSPDFCSLSFVQFSVSLTYKAVYAETASKIHCHRVISA